MERLLGIIRSGGILTARLVRQTVAPDFESCASVALATTETNPWYEIVELPLEALPTRLFPSKQKLLNAWQVLGKVGRQTPETLSAVRMVLAETVLGVPTSSAFPLTAQADNLKRKPTAAHPRAYRGTITQPPKEKTPTSADLRPVLCGTGRLEWLTEADARAVAEARQPLLFRTSLSCLTRGQSEVSEGETLALYWALGLDHDPARLAAAAYLFSLESGQNGRDWCRCVAALPEEQWTPLLSLLIASGAYAVNVQDLPSSFAEQLLEVLGGTDPLYRAYWLLHGLTAGIAPEYLISGYRLADAYGQSYTFHGVQKSGYVPIATLLSYELHCRRAADFSGGMLLRLWEQCGLRPGLGECLERAGLTRYAPEVVWRCLRLYGTSWDNWGELSEEAADAKWQAVRPQMAALEATLQSAPPEFQEKCVWHLIEYLWQWDMPTELQANLSASFRLTERLCRLPFANKSDPCEVTTDFLAELSPALRERFLNSPDSSFRQLEKACRRENDTWLIGRGTWALTRKAGEFTVRCFEAYPALLFKVAKLLGCLPRPVREAVIAPFRASPLFIEDLAVLSPADAAALVEAHRDPQVFHPIPPKLREHLAGTRTLTSAALARAADQTGTQALRAGLEMLEQAVLQTLAEGFAVEAGSGAVRHALQLERLADENRRALRKFLRAYWDGRTRYIEDHPQTRRWLAAHPRLNLDVWLQGVPYQQDLDVFGRVSLAVEQDPLEALRLGTYVGSCLGLGGGFTHSSAATVLDINKQVVYVRDAHETVLARQVVAVSEDDCLVCFSVYPLGVKPELAALFADYDRRLSQALGLPLHDARGDEDYAIARILSHAWWDDFAWDLTVDEA